MEKNADRVHETTGDDERPPFGSKVDDDRPEWKAVSDECSPVIVIAMTPFEIFYWKSQKTKSSGMFDEDSSTDDRQARSVRLTNRWMVASHILSLSLFRPVPFRPGSVCDVE